MRIVLRPSLALSTALAALVAGLLLWTAGPLANAQEPTRAYGSDQDEDETYSGTARSGRTERQNGRAGGPADRMPGRSEGLQREGRSQERVGVYEESGDRYGRDAGESDSDAYRSDDDDSRTAYSSVRGGESRYSDEYERVYDPASDERGEYVQTEYSERGTLGVTLDSRYRGAMVKSVQRGSPAERAGIQPGDYIMRVDGERIRSAQDLTSVIAEKQPGARVQISYTRRQNRTAEVSLGDEGGSYSTTTRETASGYVGDEVRGVVEEFPERVESRIRGTSRILDRDGDGRLFDRVRD